MQLISKYNKRIRFLLCLIDPFSKYSWAVPLKAKKGITIVNAFQSTLIIQKENQTKYGLIKAVNSIKSFLKNC